MDSGGDGGDRLLRHRPVGRLWLQVGSGLGDLVSHEVGADDLQPHVLVTPTAPMQSASVKVIYDQIRNLLEGAHAMDQGIVGAIVGGALATITTVVTQIFSTRREKEQLKQQKEIETERWVRENHEKQLSELRADYTECLYNLTAFFDSVIAGPSSNGQPEITEEAKMHRRGAQKSLMKLLTSIGDIDAEFKEEIRVFLEFSDDFYRARRIRDKLLERARSDQRLSI